MVDHLERKLKKLIEKLSGNRISENKIDGLIQFFKFGIVGLSNTIVSYSVYVVSVLIIDSLGIFENTNYIVGNSVAFIVGVLWSFFGIRNMYLNWKKEIQKQYY